MLDSHLKEIKGRTREDFVHCRLLNAN